MEGKGFEGEDGSNDSKINSSQSLESLLGISPNLEAKDGEHSAETIDSDDNSVSIMGEKTTGSIVHEDIETNDVIADAKDSSTCTPQDMEKHEDDKSDSKSTASTSKSTTSLKEEEDSKSVDTNKPKKTTLDNGLRIVEVEYSQLDCSSEVALYQHVWLQYYKNEVMMYSRIMMAKDQVVLYCDATFKQIVSLKQIIFKDKECHCLDMSLNRLRQIDGYIRNDMYNQPFKVEPNQVESINSIPSSPQASPQKKLIALPWCQNILFLNLTANLCTTLSGIQFV